MRRPAGKARLLRAAEGLRGNKAHGWDAVSLGPEEPRKAGFGGRRSEPGARPFSLTSSSHHGKRMLTPQFLYLTIFPRAAILVSSFFPIRFRPMKCRPCQFENSSDSRFCSRCGTQLLSPRGRRPSLRRPPSSPLSGSSPSPAPLPGGIRSSKSWEKAGWAGSIEPLTLKSRSTSP